MRAFVAIAGREVWEHRLVFVAAAAVGFLPLLLPLFVRGGDPAEVRGLFLLLVLAASLFGAGLLGGASAIGRDLAERRLGFFFARPVSGLSIWAGRLGGIVALGLLGFPLIALPTVLFGGGIPGYEWATLAGVIGGSFLLLVVLGHALGIALRSRSAWLLLDLIVPLVLGVLAWQALRPIRNGYVEPWGAAWVVGVLIALVLGVFLAAGALAVVRGRTDIQRAHRVLSLTSWTVSAMAVAACAGFLAWAEGGGPADLRSIVSVVAAPRGNYAILQGPSRLSLTHPIFIADPREVAGRAGAAEGGSVRCGPGAVLSADGSTAAWWEYEGQLYRSPAHIAYARLEPSSARRIDTRIVLQGHRWSRLYLSPDGTRLAVFHGEHLSVFDLAAEKALVELKLASTGKTHPAHDVRAAVFLSPDSLRFWRSGRGDRDRVTGQIWEVDVAARRQRQVGELPDEMSTLRVSPDGSGVLVSRWSVERRLQLDLLDGKTGALLWTRPGSLPGGQYGGQFLADGQVVVQEVRENEGFLTILTRDGIETRSIALGNARFLRVGAQTAPDRLLVAVHAQEGDPGSSLLVDLASGEILRREDGLTPATYAYGYSFGTAIGPPGGLASQLFFGRDGELILLDPTTGERRRLFPGHKSDG